jgi:hypothetical protein
MQPVFDKKKQLAEQIWKILDGKLVQDSKYSFAEIELMVEQQLAYQMKASLFSGYKVGEAINPGQFITTFESVPVQTNSARSRKYIELPARYVDLPGGKGVWSIGPMGDDYTKYIPLRLGAANFTTIDDSPFLQGNIGYEVEGMTAYFTSNSAPATVLVQLVTPNTLELNIPADFDTLVIEGTLKLLGLERESDKVNDNEERK